MVVRLGIAFLRTHGGRVHPWIVITDPIPASGMVVCVNLTTLDDDCVDDQCVLEKSDYASIEEDHPTEVAFSYAWPYDVQKLDDVIRRGLLKLASPPDVPPQTLKKIRLIAKTALDEGLQKLL